MTRRRPRTAGRIEPWDVDPITPLRLSWAGADARALEVVDAGTGERCYESGLDGVEREHLLPSGTLAPRRRYRWRLDGVGEWSMFGTGPGARWQAEAVWAAPDPGSPAMREPWTDYDVDVTVMRSRIVQAGDKPVLGAGMDVAGARRFEILARAQRADDAYVWTVDTEAGSIEVAVRRNGDDTILAAARWEPGTSPTTRIVVRLRGTSLTASVDDARVLVAEDGTWAAGAAGLGCPDGARARIASWRVTDAAGVALAGGGTERPWPSSGECDADGVLQLAERSAGLIPARGEWAFLRGTFDVPPRVDVEWGTLFLAAASPEPGRQFVARVSVNGAEVGTGPVRAIGSEHRYDGFDITTFLEPGRNVVEVVAWSPRDQRVQVEVAAGLADGRVETFGSSGSWSGVVGDEFRPSTGSVGTGYYALPRELIDPRGLARSAWRPVVVREALHPLIPNPGGKVRAEDRVVRSWRRLPDGTVVMDFGGSYVGGLVLYDVPESCDLTIRYGEMLDAAGRVRSRMATGNHYEDRWVLGPGDGAATWGLRVFRYAEVVGLPASVDPVSVLARSHVYPLGTTTRFRSNDAALREVLDLCAHTIEQANGPLMVDAWSREREPYEADAHLQASAMAALSADEALAGYSLDYLLERRTWPTEWPFYLILFAHEHYLRFGDRPALARRRIQLERCLPLRWIDEETGLVRKDTGSDGTGSRMDHDIVDWPASERDGFVFGPVNTVVNAIAVGALRALAAIDRVLDRDSAQVYEQIADRMSAAMNELLWDAERGTYIDGLDAAGVRIDHSDTHAGAFAVAFGVADDERSAQVANFLAPRGMRVSVYAAPFLLRALVRGGRVDDAYALLVGAGERSWRAMVAMGAGATMEAWSEDLKPNVSFAHPWSASPLSTVVEDLLGLRPLAPAFAEFLVAPRLPLRLTRLGATVPTASGAIAVDLERCGGALIVRIVVPPGTTCVVRSPEGDRRLTPGAHALRWA